MKNIFIAILVVVVIAPAGAQQLLNDNQYMFNKYSISPAYAGYTGNYEAFVTYRQSLTGIEGAPVKDLININGPLSEKSGIGAFVINEKYGIFKNTNIQLSYAHHIQLSKGQGLHFGISAGMLQSAISSVASETSTLVDPVFVNNQGVDQTMLDAGAGIAYSCNKINVGIAAPRLLAGKIENEGQAVYTMQQHYKVHGSYLLNVGNSIQLEPVVIATMSASSDVFYEATLVANYNKKVWLGLDYNKASMGASLGFIFKRLALAYAYEFAGTGLLAQSTGTHEFTLGFLIKDNKSDKSIFKPADEQPYHKWVE